MFTSGSPNAGQLQIGIALVLQDRFSNQAREASAEIRRLHQEAKNVTNANLGAVQSMAGMGFAVGSGLSMALMGAVKKGSEFLDTMTFVDAIVKKTDVSIADLSEGARKLSQKTMFYPTDIAQGMKYMAQAGQDSREILANIAGAANLAGATGVGIGEKGGAADVLTSVMKVFRIASSEINSNRVADVLTKVTTRTKLSIGELAEGVTYAGSTVTNLGGTLEQTAAFMGVMADAGMRGSMAGTAMANAYRYLARSIGDKKYKGHKVLESLGMSRKDFTDAQGNLIDMGEAIRRIANRTKSMNSIDRFNALVSIFNVRGERAGTTMIKSLDKYVSLLDELQNKSQGGAESIMEKRMGNLAGGINYMVSSLDSLITVFAEKVTPVVFGFMHVVGQVFNIVSRILSIPYLGPAISAFVLLGTTLLTLRLGALALKATFKLLFNDSTVSFANMVSVMTVGWRKATMSAEQYAAVEAGIIASRKAGMAANGAQVFSASAGGSFIHNNPGQYAGGVMFKNGRYYQQTGRGATGVTRISAATAASSLGSRTAQELGIVGAEAAGLGLRGAGFWGAAKGVGKLGLGLLGGPTGIALTAIAFLLPALIGAFSDNTNSHKENTSAVLTSNEVEMTKLQRSQSLNDEEQKIMLARSMDNLAKTMSSGNGPAATVIINVDGKEVIRKEIDKNSKDQVLNVGAH